jgi:hypothetical protein
MLIIKREEKGTMNRLCEEHGGDGSMHIGDAFWLCDVCSTKGIDQCHCGGAARYFGEALMCSITCPECNTFLTTVGEKYDVRQMWNDGERGIFNEYN